MFQIIYSPALLCSTSVFLVQVADTKLLAGPVEDFLDRHPVLDAAHTLPDVALHVLDPPLQVCEVRQVVYEGRVVP